MSRGDYERDGEGPFTPSVDECAFAPRHRPDTAGVCAWCLNEVPEPWYMRRRPAPAQLVGEVAARTGHSTISPAQAQAIVDALFSYADTAAQVKSVEHRRAWEDDRWRTRLRERLRSSLLDEVTKQGMIPTALPSEALRYLDAPAPYPAEQQHEVPRRAVEQGANYEFVEVTLRVPCRRVPAGRVVGGGLCSTVDGGESTGG